MLRLTLILVFLIFSFWYTNANLNFSFTWTVSSITDWDTIRVYTWSDSDNDFKVRLLWIDTPEKYLWEIKDYKFYWCWVQASHFAEQNIKIWNIYNFYLDNLAKEEDDYWRKLRFVQTWNWDNLTLENDYWYSILKEWLANFYQYEDHSFTWAYKIIDDQNKILHKWMYNPFCVAQDDYIKLNNSRVWW
jgi:hypothetical protein